MKGIKYILIKFIDTINYLAECTFKITLYIKNNLENIIIISYNIIKKPFIII